MKTSKKNVLAMSDSYYWTKYLPNGGVQWLLVKPWTSSSGKCAQYCNRRTAAAMNMAFFLGVFVDFYLFACCPGGRWGNTEQVVTRQRLPGASSVALDLLHRAMQPLLLQHVRMAIKIACNRGTFVCHCQFYHRPNRG
jgi:hypothetical protein